MNLVILCRARAICHKSGLYSLHKAKYQCLQKKVDEAKNTLASIDSKEGNFPTFRVGIF